MREESPLIKRPPGVTVLALLLGWLAVGAFVLTMTAETLAELGVRWQLVQVGALVYGLCAIVAAVGLWKMRRWGYLAFVAWVAAVLLVGLWWPAVFPRSEVHWWMGLIWIGVVAVIMLPLARYIRRVTEAAA
jgi:hypothetical protein